MKERKRNTKRPPRSMTVITLLLTAAMLLTWGVSMFCMTIVTAQELYNRLYEQSMDFIDYAETCGGFPHYYNADYSLYGTQYENPDILDYCMLQTIFLTKGYDLSLGGAFTQGTTFQLRFMRNISIPLDTAVIFYDKDGNIIHKNSNFIYFRYCTEEAWDTAETDLFPNYGWVDIGEDPGDWRTDPYTRFRTMYAGTGSNSFRDMAMLRITGTIEGAQIKPVAMYYLTDGTISYAMEQTGLIEQGADENGEEYVTYEYEISGLDRAGLLEWQLQFDHTAEVENKEDLVTVYAYRPNIYIYEGSALEYQGEPYDSLLALTEDRDFPAWASNLIEYNGRFSLSGSKFGLNRLLIFSGDAYRDWAAYDRETGTPEPDFIMVTAVVSHPLWYAICGLRDVYIGTGYLALLLVLILRGVIKGHLIRPVRDISDGMAGGWRNVYTVDSRPSMWREADELYERYTDELDHRRITKNELTRLNTALDYAKQAEEHRRQMTSNIAHELKTPLAIVHSYSEGLKEHIADEKREQYLDIILSETERMDGMVLEMLDLSRLEAGKVKLARDEFSLSALTRSVFDKFAVLAEEKHLQITLELDGDCPIVADEARIGQVITNFASNAVRYTPEGGTVLVRASVQRGKAGFFVENTSRPFTAEELSKVWETFYRTDKARSGKGTGLGLAIAKNIIELHGGTCSVRNTDTGVEFGFVL